MAITAFCASCERTVYVDEHDTPVCPVCSSPLLEVIDDRSEPEAPQEPGEKPAVQ